LSIKRPGMKKFLLLLCVSASLSASLCAQRKAYVLTDSINGKISKAEVQFLSYGQNASGDWALSGTFEMNVYYFDNDQNLIKEEQLLDLKRTDPRKKPNPVVKVIPPSDYKEPTKKTEKSDTSYMDTELGKLMVLTFTDGRKVIIGKQTTAPFHTIRSVTNKDGYLIFRRETREDGTVESAISFSGESPADTTSIEMFDQYAHRTLLTPFENNKRLHATRRSTYSYDAHGNIVSQMDYQWSAGQKLWEQQGAILYKYYYIKDGDEKGKAVAKSTESDTASEETDEPKEKKSLKEKLNPFKKKD
jgi:hypothetical protein